MSGSATDHGSDFSSVKIGKTRGCKFASGTGKVFDLRGEFRLVNNQSSARYLANGSLITYWPVFRIVGNTCSMTQLSHSCATGKFDQKISW